MLRSRLPLFVLLLAAAPAAQADVRLPAIFTSNAVFQRDMPINVWGWADKGEKVTVKIGQQEKETTADADTGKWSVKLDPLAVGDPLAMTVAGKNTLTVDNILVGEVWLCSGQSNMQFAVERGNRAKEEIAAATFPKIRLISVPLRGAADPQNDFQGKWQECSPETVKSFSAAAFFFGRMLHKELDVPIGLIHCSYGGSSCESWVNRSALEAEPSLKPMLERYDEMLRKFEESDAARKTAATKTKADAKKLPAKGKAAQTPRTNNQFPQNLYNGMLRPVMPYTMRGVIWYQGETNAGRAYQYRTLFPVLIKDWRDEWKEGEFPFYFVQLANFKATKPEPGDSDWAELREAQTLSLKAPATGQAVIIDIGEAKDIHPKNKQDVGRRLALWALAKTYGKDIEYSGPTFKSMDVHGGEVVLHFDHIGGGLMAKGSDELTGFAVAGDDKKFVWASAKIDRDTVVVSSDKVKSPVAVRYAWADNPKCNLYNKVELPACPFRTDDWPGITVGKD